MHRGQVRSVQPPFPLDIPLYLMQSLLYVYLHDCESFYMPKEF
jgi:hypothetical protein